MSKGYVYVLSNPSMPGLVKIGKTTREVGMRAAELWQTGVPTPFHVEHEVYSPDCGELEAALHKAFEGARVSRGREFFAAEVSAVIRALDRGHEEQVSEHLAEFLPNHTITDSDLFVDPSTLWVLAEALGVAPPDVATAIHFMEPEELRPGLERWLARLKK